MACPVETDAYDIYIAVFIMLWALALAVLSAVLLLNGTRQISKPQKINPPEQIRIQLAIHNYVWELCPSAKFGAYRLKHADLQRGAFWGLSGTLYITGQETPRITA